MSDHGEPIYVNEALGAVQWEFPVEATTVVAAATEPDKINRTLETLSSVITRERDRIEARQNNKFSSVATDKKGKKVASTEMRKPVGQVEAERKQRQLQLQQQ